MLYVLFYESADDVLSKAPAHFPAHSARLEEFRERGELLMVGTFSNPQEEGSMSVFATRAGAEAFAEGDPFVRNGVVRDWTLREWDAELPARQNVSSVSTVTEAVRPVASGPLDPRRAD